jgi:RNA polymerase sigma-70 factor (ECF subfamily)
MSPIAAPGAQRAGDPAGPSAAPTFGVVYAEHAATVARWAARLAGPSADVEDITQEVFVVVSRRLPEFRGQSRMSTWLFGITAKVAANERRRRKLRQWWFRLVPGVGEDAPAGGEGSLAELEKRERRVLFHRALDRLSERHRRALVLFELEELSIDEVAAHLELKAGNVRVLLHRARAAFLKSMVACELEKELR